jgi:hypothetical protein
VTKDYSLLVRIERRLTSADVGEYRNTRMWIHVAAAVTHHKAYPNGTQYEGVVFLTTEKRFGRIFQDQSERAGCGVQRRRYACPGV